MNRILDWLKNEWTGWKLILGPLLGLLISLAYLKLIMISGISYFQTPGSPTPPPLTTAFVLASTIYYFFSALSEEFAFRVPIALFAPHFDKPKTFLAFIVILSAVFGLCHGHVYNIALQGFHGLVFSLVFIKTGGLNLGLVGTLRAWFIAALVHTGYNLSILFFPQFFL